MNSATTTRDVSHPAGAIIDVRFCAEHDREIEDGARWLTDADEFSHPLHTRMGIDLPPKVTRIAASRGHFSSDPDSYLMTFTVENGDGTEDTIELQTNPDRITWLAHLGD